MDRKAYSTDKAPAAIGPYSQAVQAGGFLYVSGQLPIDPATGEMTEADIRAQGKRVLENIKAILENAGSTMEKVVKVEVFLADMNHFPEMNEIYARYFKGDILPARQAVQVARLPKDSLVEISCIALI